MEAVTADAVVVEVLDSHGRVHTRERLSLAADRRSFTVGRSTAADVMLDDAYVAALHVAIEVTPEGLLRATDLGSVNGIVIKAKRHRHAQGLELPDGLLQVGRTHLRVRTPREALAAEKPDHGTDDSRAGRIAYSGALACIFFIGYFSWLSAPWDPATVMAIAVMTALPGAGMWIALWALLSRVTTGEWRWMTHAAILFGVFAAVLALSWVLDLAWFSFDLPQWPWRDALLLAVTAALVLFWHLTQGSTMTRRTAVLVAVLLPAVAIGATTWTNLRNQNRNVNFIGAHVKLYPPALRVREGGTLDAYFTASARLKDAADRRRKAMPGEEGDETAEEE
jgi:hypothetical protein